MNTKNHLRIIRVIVALASFCAVPLSGQQDKPNQAPIIAGTPAGPELLFNRMTIQLKDGGLISGLLVGVGDAALLVRRGGKDESVPMSNLRRVVIEKEKNRSLYGLLGMSFSFYVLQLSRRARNQPTAFASVDWGINLLDLLMAAAGGGAGYFLGPSLEKKQAEFSFDGTGAKRQAEWEKLRRFVLGVTSPAKAHFQVHGGRVNMRVSNRSETLFKNIGYYLGGYYLGDSEWSEPAGSINLLRRIQFTLSIMSRLEAGLAVVFLGEPTIGASKYATGVNASVSQSLSAIGYFVVGSYHPFQKMLPKWISWDVGLGIGAAKVDFKLKTFKRTFVDYYPYSQEEILHSQGISKTLFGGVISSTLDVFPSRNLSLGLSADYVFLPSDETPAIAAMGIPAQKVRFGNSCFGLTMGLHF
jgi:hypothetical protein